MSYAHQKVDKRPLRMSKELLMRALVKPKGPVFNSNFSRLENKRVLQFYHVKPKSEDKRPNLLSERTL